MEMIRTTGERHHHASTWLFGDIKHEVALKTTMTILGVCVDMNGSTACALDNRLAQAWAHWIQRKSVLSRSEICLRARW
jgi:hypothetical protein